MDKMKVRCGYCGRKINNLRHLCYCEGLSFAQLGALKLRSISIRIKKLLKIFRDPGVKLGFEIAGIVFFLVFGSGLLYLLIMEGFRNGL